MLFMDVQIKTVLRPYPEIIGIHSLCRNLLTEDARAKKRKAETDAAAPPSRRARPKAQLTPEGQAKASAKPAAAPKNAASGKAKGKAKANPK